MKFEENTCYRLINSKLSEFKNAHFLNEKIADAINTHGNGIIFVKRLDSSGDVCKYYLNGIPNSTIKDACLISQDERKFFEEVNETEHEGDIEMTLVIRNSNQARLAINAINGAYFA